MDNTLKLIQTLGKNLKFKVSIKELSEESGVPYTTTNRLVKKNKNLFVLEDKGNLKLCSLNLKDDITKNYLIIAERQKTENFLSNNPQFRLFIKDLPQGNYSLILFGSRAEGKQRKKSDVDLCAINENGNKNIDLSKYETLFKLEINPLFLKRKEFIQMLKEEDHNLTKEIIKKHVILYGEEYFWSMIWENKNGIK